MSYIVMYIVASRDQYKINSVFSVGIKNYTWNKKKMMWWMKEVVMFEVWRVFVWLKHKIAMWRKNKFEADVTFHCDVMLYNKNIEKGQNHFPLHFFFVFIFLTFCMNFVFFSIFRFSSWGICFYIFLRMSEII